MADNPDLNRRSFLRGRLAERRGSAVSPVAVIAPFCFAFQGIVCMSCRDACPTGSVQFHLAAGGARPKIEPDACTGCGDCSQACPANAISLSAAEAVS